MKIVSFSGVDFDTYQSQMCQTFIPLMKKTGRIVNMSSEFSSLKLYSNEIKQRFQDPELTLEGLGTLVSEYEVSRAKF